MRVLVKSTRDHLETYTLTPDLPEIAIDVQVLLDNIGQYAPECFKAEGVYLASILCLPDARDMLERLPRGLEDARRGLVEVIKYLETLRDEYVSRKKG